MKAKLSVLLFCSCVSGYSFAQSGYNVDHYTAENGLPQNSVKSIAADSEGFIWLATEDGLVRFDGHRFYVFNTSNLNVKSNRVSIIQPSSRNSVLPENPSLSSERAHVAYAKVGLDEAVRIENGRATYDTTYSLNRDMKLYPLKKDSKDIYSILGLPDSWYNYPVPNYHFMITGGREEGNFYVCTKTHANYFRNWKIQYKIANPVSNPWNYFSIGERLYYFHQRGVFDRIFDKKLSKFSMAGDILYNTAYKTGKADIKLYSNNNSDQAFLFLAGNLYELEQQRDGSLVTRLLVKDFDLPPREIDVIHFDKTSGKIYLGSSTNGLYVLSKHQFQTLTVTGDDRPNIFYSQLPYLNNAVLTSTGIIVGKDSLTDRIIDKRLRTMAKINPFDARIIVRDRNDQLWIKNKENLIQLDRNGKKVIKQWRFKNEIKAICQGKDSQVWVGVINQGLYKVDPEDPDAIPRFFGADSLKDITYLESLSKKQLLAGTATGLFSIDLSTQKPRLIEGTKGVYIKSIHILDRNRAWVTAQTKGLMLLDTEKGLVTFPLDKNRYLASPHCVVNDGVGYLWVPTNRGLFQMNVNDLLAYAKLKSAANTSKLPAGQNKPPSELFYMYHAMDEGFNTNEFNGSCQPCGVKLANGYISLPSLNGLVWFRSEWVSRYRSGGHIILDKAEVNQQSTSVSGDTVRLPLNPENIKLYLSTAYFGNDYNLNLSYAIAREGSDARSLFWLPIDNKDFTVRYSSLNSGKYTLIVRKQTGFGINSYTVKKIHLIIPQMWYETAVAIFLFVIALILVLTFAVYFYNAYRLKAIKREKAALEEIVLSRTVSLETALNELEQSKSRSDHQVHIMSRILASITHDVQSPLKYIAIASGYIPGMVQKQQFDQISDVGTMITDLSHRTGNMLRDLLDYIKIQVYDKRMSFEQINLKKMVDNNLELFESFAENKGIFLANELADTIQVTSDYQLLAIVVRNLIDNAVKHTHQGEIRISAQTSSSQTELIISNSGLTLAQEKIDLINSPTDVNEISYPFNDERSTGLGLVIVREVAQLIGIKVKVTQTDVTSFYLIFN